MIVKAIGDWPTNAHLIADAHALGYFDRDTKGNAGSVLDATYGEGNFWTVWRPEDLTTNDLHKPADYQADYRDLPFPSLSFDAVVFDPPYKLNGTPAMGEMDRRYGTDTPSNRDQVMASIADGAAECWRVTRRWLLVKVMDQVEGGQMRWQTDLVTGRLAPLGARKVARFDYPNHGIPQPESSPCRACGANPDGCDQCTGGRVPRKQRTPRNEHSQLLVFRRMGGR